MDEGPNDSERRAIDAGDEEELALHVARRYYLEDQSKVEVARALGLSRFQVARLIADARRRGQVRIEIGAPGRLDAELGADLAVALGIGRAVVVQTAGDTRAAVTLVADALAGVLADAVAVGDLVGVAWSKVSEALARSRTRPALQPCTVLQLAGSLPLPGDQLGAVEVVRALATASGGTALPVYAPFVLDSDRTALALRLQSDVADVLDRVSDLDLAVLSVGTWRPGGSAVFDGVDEAARAEGVAAGVVGTVCGRLLGRDGSALATSLDGRVLGVTLTQLRAVPQKITTAHGVYCADATRAAVRAGLVDTLVLDDALARALLAET